MIKTQINKTNMKETNNIYLGVSAQFEIEKVFIPVAQVVLTEDGEKCGEINIPYFPVEYADWGKVIASCGYEGAILMDVCSSFDDKVKDTEIMLAHAVCYAYDVPVSKDLVVAVCVRDKDKIIQECEKQCIYRDTKVIAENIYNLFNECMKLYYNSYGDVPYPIDDSYRLFSMWRADNIKNTLPNTAQAIYDGYLYGVPFDNIYLTQDGQHAFMLFDADAQDNGIVDMTQVVMEALQSVGYFTNNTNNKDDVSTFADTLSKAVYGVTDMFKVCPMLAVGEKKQYKEDRNIMQEKLNNISTASQGCTEQRN